MPDKYGVGQEKDCYANSDVLINLLGITDMARLSEAEMAFTTLRLSQYDYPIFSDFSLQTLKNIHFYLFQDVYIWAGELRVVDISKGTSRFASCNRIEPEAQKLFTKLRCEKFLTGWQGKISLPEPRTTSANSMFFIPFEKVTVEHNVCCSRVSPSMQAMNFAGAPSIVRFGFPRMFPPTTQT